MTCEISRGGLAVFPIGSRPGPRNNCKKTILNSVDPIALQEGLRSVKGKISIESIKTLKSLAERGELIAWGAKPGSGKGGSFQSKQDAECAESLAKIFTETGQIPGEWYVIFNRANKLVCKASLVGVVKSRRLAELFWGSGDWQLIFFGARSGCHDELDKDCSVKPNTGIDYQMLVRALGWRGPGNPRRRTIVRPGLHVKIFDNLGYCHLLRRVLGDKAVVIDVAEKLLRAKHALLLYGPPGTGKTALALCLAERLSARVFMVTGHAWLTRHTIIGGYILKKNSSEWRDGVVLEAARNDGVSLVILDEINRAEPERVLGELFTALSRPDLRLDVPETGKSFSLENVYIVATANSLDTSILGRMGFALHRRFAVLHLNHNDANEEELRREAARLLGNDDCARRAAEAGVGAWRAVLDYIVKVREDEEKAPGWGYALDMARAVHALACPTGSLEAEQTELACQRAVESIVGEYVRMALQDEESKTLNEVLNNAVKACVKALGEGKGES